ncbi:MAG: DUF998 domain-containing protein [Candidatus Helarchaeota archaeon]
MNLIYELKVIFQGKFSKKTLMHYYLPFLIIFPLLCLLVARLFYPYIPLYPYNWTTSMISRLGWPEENPTGFIFFSIGFIVEGIMLLPLSHYLYKKFLEVNEITAKIIRFLLIFYSVATLLIGLIPNYSKPPIFGIVHGINAIIIFFGFFLLSVISELTLLSENQKKKEKSKFSRNLLIIYTIFLVYYSVCIFLIVLTFQFSIPGRSLLKSTIPFYMSPPFYEWQAYMLILSLLATKCQIFPEDIKKINLRS